MVVAQDILRKEPITKDANDNFSQAMNLLDTTDAILITDQNKYQGMLLRRTLLEPTVTPQTKLHTLLTHPPKLNPTTSLEEIASAMIENNIYTLPVLDKDTVLGIVTADDVIKKLTEQSIGTQPIQTIMCTTPLSVPPDETIGKVLHIFRQQHIPYLPIVDHTCVVGTITLSILAKSILHSPINVKGRNNFESEKRQILDVPIKSIMQEQPLLLSPETSIKEVHNKMHQFELPGVLIGKDDHLQGVVTHKELLAPYAGFEKEENIAIQFHHRNSTVQGFDKVQAAELLHSEFLKNYEKFLESGYLHVSLEQHKETKQGLFRVVCEMRLSGKPGMFYATQEGYGPHQAMRNAFLAIEHQIKRVKRT
jgi:CBS domain-containing protein